MSITRRRHCHDRELNRLERAGDLECRVEEEVDPIRVRVSAECSASAVWGVSLIRWFLSVIEILRMGHTDAYTAHRSFLSAPQ